MAPIRYGNGGWVRVEDADLPGPLYLRFAQDDARRWRVREFYLDGSDGRFIEAADLQVKLSSLTTLIVDGPGRDALARKAAFAAPDLSALASYYNHSFGSQARHWVAESFRAQMRGDDITKTDTPSTGTEINRSRVAPLKQPTEGLTDDFLRHVAAAYAEAVRQGKRPVSRELAAQADVSHRTVNNWVYIARKRGLMDPGRPGRIGG